MDLDGKIAGGDGFRVCCHLAEIGNHFGERAIEIADLVVRLGGKLTYGKVAGGYLAGVGDREPGRR